MKAFRITDFVQLTFSPDDSSNGHVGALTDGKFWKFFYIVSDRFYQTDFVADSDENVNLILGIFFGISPLTLGILTLFSAGHFPTTSNTDPTWIDVPRQETAEVASND